MQVVGVFMRGGLLHSTLKFFLNIRYLKNKLSFSLLELSVVLAVSGILIAGGISAYKSTNPKLKSDLKKMEKIEEALQQFFTTNGRLPFPARPSDYNGTAYYLKEYRVGSADVYSKAFYKLYSSGAITESSSTQYCNDASCTTYAGGISYPTSQLIWGVVPVRTLGLPDDYAYDSQGKNFEYITDLQLATSNEMAFNSGTYRKANYVTNQQGKYEVYYKSTYVPPGNDPISLALANHFSHFSLPLFSATIVNANTAKEIEATTDNVAYVLLSKQKQSCYWNNRAKNATITNATVPTDNTRYNCQANYTNGNYATINIYQGYSKTFDNVVKYNTLSNLIEGSYKAQENAQGIYSSRSSSSNGYFNALPVGTMVLFYLHSSNIPRGWQICNGTNGTPDMRGNFALGAVNDNDVNTTGGANSITLTEKQMPKHKHLFKLESLKHSHKINVKTTEAGEHQHAFCINMGDSNGSTTVDDAGGSEGSLCGYTQKDGKHEHEVKGNTEEATFEGDDVFSEEAGGNDAIDVTNKHRKIYFICKIK